MCTCMCANIPTQVGIYQNPFLQVRSSLLSLRVSLNSLSSLLLSSSSPLFALLFLIPSPFPKWRCCGGRRGCPWQPAVHDLLLIQAVGGPQSRINARWQNRGPVNPHSPCSACSLVNQPAGQSVCQSLNQPCSHPSLCARCPYLPYSAPITTSTAWRNCGSALHPALTLWLTCRPLAITPGAPLHGLPFHCRTHHWLTPRPVGKMS